MNAERFAQIDLDRSRFDYECNHSLCSLGRDNNTAEKTDQRLQVSASELSCQHSQSTLMT